MVDELTAPAGSHEGPGRAEAPPRVVSWQHDSMKNKTSSITKTTGLIYLFLAAAGLLAGGRARGADRPEGLVIVDASEFVHRIPKGDTLADAQTLGVPWVFNNVAIALKSREDAVATVSVAEPGTYHLSVRSHGTPGGSFRVVVDGKSDPGVYGDAPMSLRAGGTFELKPGPVEVRLADIVPSPVFDVLVLAKDNDFREADLLPLQFPPDVAILKDYKIPPASAVKFGDLTGDGRMDFVVLTPDYSAFAFDHDGRELWRHQAPADGARLRSEFEAPGSVWDFDRDGLGEVVHWRMIDGRESLVMADGRTGAVKHSVPWPTTPMPHVYNNFRTAIARLRPGHADSLAVLTDSGGTISVSAFGPDLKPLWTHTELREKDHLGHYLYPVDLDGDGVDEVVVSHLALDASGRRLWDKFGEFPDNHDHVDSFRFADLDGDGRLEALGAQSDVGVVVYGARTGEVLWKRPADHGQQITFGDFVEGVPAPQVVVNARTYGRRRGEAPLSAQVYWFDPGGILLSKWPLNPLNGNPDFVKGDWRGDGKIELFWYKFRMGPDGKGTLAFGEPVYHMFDFLGNGSEQVIALRNRQGVLRVYGCRDSRPRPASRDPEYLRNAVANHTHY